MRGRPAATNLSIVDRLFGEDLDFVVEGEAAGWVKLGHEDDNHVFFGVDGESGVEEAAPANRADGAEFIEWRFDSADAEADAETHVGVDFSDLIVRHEFEGFSAEDARVAEFAAIQNHLRKTGVVHHGGDESGAT